MAKQTGNGIRQSIYFEPKAYQQAEQIRRSEGLSRSAFICRAVNYYAARDNDSSRKES